MAQTTSHLVGPASDHNAQIPSSFNLKIISPSQGVDGPIIFTELAVSTTVKEVKAKLRDLILSKPADEGQRLIYNGRLLTREMDTMLDTFGHDTLRASNTVTLHLVVSEAPPATTGRSSQETGSQGLQVQLQSNSQSPSTSQPRPQSALTQPPDGPLGHQPSPTIHHLQHHQAMQQAFHQASTNEHILAQRAIQLHQEARRLQREITNLEQRSAATASPAAQPDQSSTPNQQVRLPVTATQPLPPHLMPTAVRNLIAQQQQERFATSRNGAQVPSPESTSNSYQPLAAPSNLARPEGTSTYTQAGVGTNGERWTVTVNQTNVTVPFGTPRMLQSHRHLGRPRVQQPWPGQIQNALRGTERVLDQNINSPVNLTDRTASNLLPVPPIPASTTGTAGAGHTSTSANSTLSFRASNTTSANTSTQANPLSVNTGVANVIDPIVYLLSSPEGPRALLHNNSYIFYSPQPSHIDNPREDGAATHDRSSNVVGSPENSQRRETSRFRGPRRPHVVPRVDNNLAAANAAAPQVNINAVPVAAQFGPMLWLVIRLIGLVWFFTAGNPSWSRWVMVSGLAVIVFIVNTGILNGTLEQFWGPVRRHIENLIPLAGPNARQIPDNRNARVPRGVGAENPPVFVDQVAPQQVRQSQAQFRGEFDPAQVAARLLNQHSERNIGWITTQIRRIEHALLLFLASLVPGVGERHIAAREAEINAVESETQRRNDATETPETATDREADEPVESTEQDGNAAINVGTESSQAPDSPESANNES